MLTALHVVPRPGSEVTEAVVGAYAFSATLAVQDITGLATSGVTPSHIAKRLEGSAESEAHLFALTSRSAPRPLGPLGYPQLVADDLLDIEAWVFVSLPLLEDVGVLEANVTLDASIAPLPGEDVPVEPWQGAFLLIDALSNALARPTRHLWVTHPPGTWTPPGAVKAGYTAAFREDQAVFTASAAGALAGGGTSGAADWTIDVVEGPGFAGYSAGASPEGAEQFAALLTAASRDYPRGDLLLEPITWDLQRITDAGARLMDRGGNQLTGVASAISGNGGGGGNGEGGGAMSDRVVGICEAVHYTSDSDAVCELGLIYVLPEFRGRGIGSALIAATVARARDVWEDLETVYLSYPAGSPAAEAIVSQLGAEVVSSTTAWQRLGG